MNRRGWLLAALGGAILGGVDAAVGPLAEGIWWAVFAGVLGAASALCWHGTVDVDDPRARAAVVFVQLPLLAAGFWVLWGATRWWILPLVLGR